MTRGNLDLGSLETSLNRVPFPLTLSDVSAPDHPLIFMNTAFFEMTGYDETYLGQNCRFLQADFDNTDARAEIRDALAEGRRTQVILRNQRRDGTAFLNLLLLAPVGQYAGLPDLVLGSQFELTRAEEEALRSAGPLNVPSRGEQAYETALNVRLERRRVLSNSALSLLRSWCVLNTLTQDGA